MQELTPTFQPPNLVQLFRLPVGASGIAILDMLKTKKGAVNISATTSRQDGFFE